MFKRTTMRNYTQLFSMITAMLLWNFAEAQSWRAVIELGNNPEVPFCDAVQNGIAQIPPALANSNDYRTRFILDDTIYVGNNFVLEARVLNAESNGGIRAFDPGIYLEGCDIDAGASLMGEIFALHLTSIYAGSSSQVVIPEFVQDFSQWRIIRYAFRDNVFYVFFDNQLLYSLPYNGNINFLYQIMVRFKGSGLLDYVKLYDGTGAEIWVEEFNDCNNLAAFPDLLTQTSFSIISDTLVCLNEPLNIAANAGVPATYQWLGPGGFASDQASFTLNNVAPADTGYYFVIAEFADCVQWHDSVHIGLVEPEIPPADFLGSDTTLCLGETLTLGQSYPCASYQWQDGSADSTFLVENPGTYFVQIEIYGQIYSDTIEIAYYPLPQIALGNDTTLCPGETILLDAALSTASSYLWQDGSADSIFLVENPGTYIATVTDVCGNSTADTIEVAYFQVLTNLDLGRDTTLCPGERLVLDASDPAAISYLWQDGSTGSSFTVDTPGMYAVELQDNCGNILIDSIIVQYFEVIQSVSLGRDTTLCPGETLNLNVETIAAKSYLWQDGSTNPTFTIQQAGNYSVTIEDNCGNSVKDEIIVNYFAVLENLDLGGDTSLCPGERLILNASDPAAISYLWQDGSAKSELTVDQPGIYSVTLSDNCGNVLSDSIELTYYQLITSIDLGEDETLCEGESRILNASDPAAASYLWQDGSTGSTFEVEQPGIYTVVVHDNCGNSATDEVRIRFDEAPIADLGPDTLVCEGSVYLLNAKAQDVNYYYWQDGTVDHSFAVTEPGVYSVVVGNACGFNTSQVTIEFEYCGPCRTAVPNAFSPNGDNVNDKFEIFSECSFTKFDLRIFDRWGMQVFASQNPNNQWDGTLRGTPLKTGVYIWRLAYEADDGSSGTLSGDCTLLR